MAKNDKRSESYPSSETTKETVDTAKPKNGKRGSGRPNAATQRNRRSSNRKTTSGTGSKEVTGPTSRGNDASWWNKFGNLAEIACNLSWNVMNGAPRTRSYTEDPLTWAGSATARVLPTDMGVAVIETVPGLGACKQIGDPINKAVIEIYNMVRWNKNANVPYDPADIGKLLWSYDSFISFLACMRRFYALTNAVDPRNRYVARSLILAMGADPDDLYTNRAQLVYKINELAIQAAKINIPAEFKVFDRHELLYDNIFIDAPIARGTFYAFVPRVLAKYNDTSLRIEYVNFLNSKYEDQYEPATSASTLMPPDTLPEGTARWTVASLSNLGDQLLDAIQTSADFYMLNANIYGAYSERGLHPVKVIDSFYTISPLYREEVLSQIHNAEFADVDFSNIYVAENAAEGDPDVGALQFVMSVPEQTALDLGYNKIVDVPWEHPSVDDVLEATRLKCTATQEPAKILSSGWMIESCGTEVCTSLTLWYYTYNSGLWKMCWREMRGYTSINVASRTQAAMLNFYAAEASMLTKVDKYPLTTVFSHTISENSVTSLVPICVFGNMDNYAMLDTNQLRNIHTAALLSVLLNGPTVLSHPVSETK